MKLNYLIWLQTFDIYLNIQFINHNRFDRLIFFVLFCFVSIILIIELELDFLNSKNEIASWKIRIDCDETPSFNVDEWWTMSINKPCAVQRRENWTVGY